MQSHLFLNSALANVICLAADREGFLMEQSKHNAITFGDKTFIQLF